MNPLICINCGDYLSHAPVYLHQSTSVSFCGVCAQEKPNLIRNTTYEIVADVLEFPCKYHDYGCGEFVSFSAAETEEHPHEIDCKYRTYLCPMDKLGECEWQGPVRDIYLHFLYEHPSAIFDNPCVFNHDIEYPNIYICLVPACGELFLIQAEVLLPEGRIFHSVRFFGTRPQDYKFELFIQRHDTYISRIGNVFPMNSMDLNETTSITTNIENLVDFVGSFDNCQFTINIQSVDDLQDDETEAYCHFCNKWRYLEQGVCVSCRLEMKTCSKRANGCCQINLTSKAEKHEALYCNFSAWCDFCDDFIAGSKNHHYLTKHVSHELGNFVHVTRTYGRFLAVFFRCDFGIVCCNYYLSNKKMEIQVVTPLANVQLRNFLCRVFIRTNNGDIIECVLEEKVRSFYDWVFCLQKCNFNAWSSNFWFKVEIERIHF